MDARLLRWHTAAGAFERVARQSVGRDSLWKEGSQIGFFYGRGGGVNKVAVMRQ